MAVEPTGDILAVDRVTHRLRRVAADGKVTDVATVQAPQSVLFDKEGAILVLTDRNLMRVNSGNAEAILKDPPFEFPHDAVLHPNGNLYVSDGYAKALWQIDPQGKVSALAQGEPLESPQGLSVDGEGNLLVADPHAKAIFKVNVKGEVSVLAPAKPVKTDKITTAMTNEHDDREILEAVRTIFDEKIPFNKVLGLKVATLDHDRPSLEARDARRARGQLLQGQSPRRSHLIRARRDRVDSSLFSASFRPCEAKSMDETVQRFSRMGTIDLRVNYLRPGLGKRFLATGYILRMGNRVAVTRMELTGDEERLIAVGTGAYLVS